MNKIVYHNFAPGAAENAVFSDESNSFNNTVSLIEESDPINFATLENNGIDLFDSNLYFADNTDNVGFISSDISNSNRVFSNSGIRLVFSLAGGYYSGPGITLHFIQNICPEIFVEFFRDDELLTSGKFKPVTPNFFCDLPAEKYNKVVCTFLKSEIPYQFVKLKKIDFGRIDELKEFFGPINVFEEISVDCTDLPYDTCEFDAIIPEEIYPQSGQSFYVFHGSKCFGKFVIKNATEENSFGSFCVKSADDKYILGNSPFPELPQNTYTINDILSCIKQNSDISVDDCGYGNTEITGFINSGKNSRYAAAMMSMGSGLFISSARSGKLKLKKVRDRRNYVISSDRILTRPEYTKKAPYTSINLFVHGGSDFDDETAEIYSAENKNLSANIAVNVLNLNRFSLFCNPDTRTEELKTLGFERNEICAKFILNDEETGDILKIETPRGLKTGIIQSLDISIQGSEVIADAKLIEMEDV